MFFYIQKRQRQNLIEKYIALNTFIRKQKRLQILKPTEKKSQKNKKEGTIKDKGKNQ